MLPQSLVAERVFLRSTCFRYLQIDTLDPEYAASPTSTSGTLAAGTALVQAWHDPARIICLSFSPSVFQRDSRLPCITKHCCIHTDRFLLCLKSIPYYRQDAPKQTSLTMRGEVRIPAPLSISGNCDLDGHLAILKLERACHDSIL
jgi:hypothetical protein